METNLGGNWTCYKEYALIISINQICDHFGVDFCVVLPAFHAFPGCNYIASFNRKGKVRPLKLLEKDKSAQQSFSNLNE